MGGKEVDRKGWVKWNCHFSVIPRAQIHDKDLGKGAIGVYIPSAKLWVSEYVQPTNNKDDTISQNATEGLTALRKESN